MGAAIGGGLAALTAIGTSWFNIRVARLQHAVQEIEAARQRRFEVLRERREPRERAYADFLTEGQEILDIIRSRYRDEDLRDELWSLLGRLNKQRSRVVIVGPASVADAATAFMMAYSEFRAEFHAGNQDAWKKGVLAQTVLERFTVAARAALEDDGSSPDEVVSPPGR